MSKKIIAVDNDDVLFPFVETFFTFYNSRFKTDFDVKKQLEYKLNKTLDKTEEETMKFIFEFYKSTLILKMKPINGALSVLKELKKKYSLIVITARPFETRDITIQAINQHFSGIFDQVYLTNSYSLTGPTKTKAQVCQELGVSVLIEDSPTNIKECAAVGIKTIMFTRPWNRDQVTDIKSVTPAKDWPEILKAIKLLDI